ncbi:MAG: hypothetical protein ACI9XP_001706 [Lentimonas sp.]|jgi:hypothetical protein
MQKRILLLIFTLSGSFLFGQQTNFNSQDNWSLNKKEFMFGFGATNFLGDLGGRNRIGTDYSLIDFDFPAISLGMQIGYRYRFKPRFATGTVLNFGLLRGSDQNTEDLVRSSRNLSFRAPIISLNQRLEWIVYSFEQLGGRYRIYNVRRRSDRNKQLYLFGGLGGAFFNPQGKLDGKWHNLHPLKTEGQGLVGGVDPYKRVTIIAPIGVGYRVGIDKLWRVGFEVSLTATLTDYIDDVSKVYYDRDKLRELYGDKAAYFSNPSDKNTGWFTAGQQRGDKQRDSYVLFNIVFYKNLTYQPADYKFAKPAKYKGQRRYKF